MRDLRPYICSYGGCPEEARIFRRRRDWFQHELDVHRVYWECPRCSLPLSSKHDFKLHTVHSHQTQLTQEQIESLAKGMSKQQDGRHQTNCGLCGAEFLVNETLRRHLAGEMEEIALFVMPRQYDFWDGSDGSSDTDTSDSTDELVEEPTSSGLTEANITHLADSTLKEGVTAPHIAPDFPEQRATELGKQALHAENALESIEETLSVLPDNTQEETGDMPIKAAVKTDSPAPEGEFWIPEDSPDTKYYESFHEGFNNPDAGSEPAVRYQTSTSSPPATLLSQSAMKGSHFVLNTAHSFEDNENDVDPFRAFRTASRPMFVPDKSPETACRTDYEENHVTEINQYDAYIHTHSLFALEGATEDTLSYHHEGLDMSQGQAQGSTGNEHPTFNAPLEPPPASVVLRLSSPVRGIASPKSPPSSPASPSYASRGTVPTAHSDRTKGPIPADTCWSPDLGHKSSYRPTLLNLGGDIALEMPEAMGISMVAPYSPPAVGAFKCSHPGCTAPPFQTGYLLASHTNVHSSDRPHYCPVQSCPRSIGGKGFKRKNEMIRHGLVHKSPGYVCPFCADQLHKYPRPDNLQRYSSICFER
jgi:hypothetical protein